MFPFVATLVLAAVVARRLWLGYPPTSCARLGRGEAAFVTAAAETLFPPHDRLPLDGRAADLPAYADDYLAGLPVRQQRLIRALFLLFEHATLVFPPRGIGAFRRFSSTTPEQRRVYLESWARSRLAVRRMALAALKAVLILGYVGREANLRALGLERWEIEPVVCEADLLYPPIGAPRSAIRLTREDLTVDRPRSPLRAAAGEGA